MKRVVMTAICVTLASCVGIAQPTAVSTVSTFNPAEITWFTNGHGSNSIEGNAVLRTRGGDVRTCAGLPVNLVPVSAYARERFQLMYGNLDRGFLAARRGFRFASTDPNYESLTRTVRCDAEGDFAFDGLPDGDYFVTALVTWDVPTAYFTMVEGGYLMQRVHLSGNQVQRIVLTAP